MPPIEDDTPEEEVTKVEKPQATQKQEKPSTKKESTQKPSTKKQDKPSKPSSGYTRQRGVPGTFPKTKLDQDGDGLEDAIQDDVIIGPIEEGVLDPDFDYNLGD